MKTTLTDVPVSLSGDNLTRTTQIGNGDNAPDTDRLVAKVEPVHEVGKTAQDSPSLRA